MPKSPVQWPEAFSVLMTTVEKGSGLVQRVSVDGLLSRIDTLADDGTTTYTGIFNGQEMISLSIHWREHWYKRDPLTRSKDGKPATLRPHIPEGGDWATIGPDLLHGKRCTRFRHTGTGWGGMKIVNDVWADDATHAPARIGFGESWWDFTEFHPGKPDPKLFATDPPEG